MLKKSISFKLFRNTTIIISIIFFIQFFFQVFFFHTFFINKKVEQMKSDIQHTLTDLEVNSNQGTIITIISNLAKKANSYLKIINFNDDLVDTDTLIKIVLLTDIGHVTVYALPNMNQIHVNEPVTIQGYKNNTNNTFLASYIKVNDQIIYGDYFSTKNNVLLDDLATINHYNFKQPQTFTGKISSVSYPTKLIHSDNELILHALINLQHISNHDLTKIRFANDIVTYYTSLDHLVFLTPITIQHQNYYLISVTPLDMNSHYNFMIFFNGLILIVLFLMSVLLCFIHAKKFTKPLKKLVNYTSHYTELDIHDHFQYDCKNELYTIADNFKKLIHFVEDTKHKMSDQDKKLYSYLKKELQGEKNRIDFLKYLGDIIYKPFDEIKLLSKQLDGKNIDDYHKRVKLINDNVLKINKIVDDLIIIKELNQSNYIKVFGAVDLKLTVEKVIRELEDDFIKNKLILKLNINPNYIYGDKYKISLAVKYLIMNTINQAGDNKFIHINLVERNNKVSLSILHLATYLSNERLNALFQPFNNMDKFIAKENDSSLLYLYIAKLILDEHKAEFGAYNEASGVTYYFNIAKYDVHKDINL